MVFFDIHTRTSLARSAANIGSAFVNILQSRFTPQIVRSEGTSFNDRHKYAFRVLVISTWGIRSGERFRANASSESSGSGV